MMPCPPVKLFQHSAVGVGVHVGVGVCIVIVVVIIIVVVHIVDQRHRESQRRNEKCENQKWRENGNFYNFSQWSDAWRTFSPVNRLQVGDEVNAVSRTGVGLKEKLFLLCYANILCTLKREHFKNWLTLGSGCGSVGRASTKIYIEDF